MMIDIKAETNHCWKQISNYISKDLTHGHLHRLVVGYSGRFRNGRGDLAARHAHSNPRSSVSCGEGSAHVRLTGFQTSGWLFRKCLLWPHSQSCTSQNRFLFNPSIFSLNIFSSPWQVEVHFLRSTRFTRFWTRSYGKLVDPVSKVIFAQILD